MLARFGSVLEIGSEPAVGMIHLGNLCGAVSHARPVCPPTHHTPVSTGYSGVWR
jgi:hypothetical protein